MKHVMKCHKCEEEIIRGTNYTVRKNEGQGKKVTRVFHYNCRNKE